MSAVTNFHPGVVALLLGSALVLRAAPAGKSGAQIPTLTAPRYPAVLMVKRDDKLWPVVEASGRRAVIEIAGERTTVPKKSEYVIDRGYHYATGEAVFTGATKRVTSYSTVDIDSGAGIGGTHFRDSKDFNVVLSVSEGHEHAFVAVLFVNSTFLAGRSKDATSFLYLREIGAIEANKSKYVEVDVSEFGRFDLARSVAIPIFFDAGREVHSNFSDLLGTYERRRDLAKHRNVLANYTRMNPAGNRESEPYVLCEPARPGNAPFKASRVDVTMQVDADGIVRATAVPAETDPQEALEIRRALQGWLFLPRLEDGKCVPSMCQAVLEPGVPP